MTTQDPVLDQMFNSSSVTGVKDEIICIVDRSGSMQSIRADAQGGLNTFIEDQKKVPGGANLTLVEFDSEYNKISDRIDIQLAESYVLRPRGSTALLDAIGLTLNGFPETEGKKIVAIVTDGGENSSQEYTRESVFKRITELQEAGWEFLFLAANQDAIQVGGSLGIAAASTMTFDASAKGVETAYMAGSTYVSNLRSCGKAKAVADLDQMKFQLDEIS